MQSRRLDWFIFAAVYVLFHGWWHHGQVTNTARSTLLVQTGG